MVRRYIYRGVGLAAAAALCAACEFNAPNPGNPPPDARPPDAPPLPPDGMMSPRVTSGLLAFWTFDEASGTVANDTRNALIPQPQVEPTQLVVADAGRVRWTGAGLELTAPVRVGTTARTHISEDVLKSNAVTIEIWVAPAAVSQGASNYALAFSISPSYAYHNAMIAQVDNRWQGRVLTRDTTSNGVPFIAPPDQITDLSPVHLVLVASEDERVMYVNGAPFRSEPDPAFGDLNDPAFPWFYYFPVSVGDERDVASERRPWLGTIFLAAIYDRALSEAEILKNRDAGHACQGC